MFGTIENQKQIFQLNFSERCEYLEKLQLLKF